MEHAGGSVLALDIGGTKLAAGICCQEGRIERQLSVATLATEGAPAVLDRVIALAHDCCQAEVSAGGRVDAVGVSTMGFTFPTHVELAPNVPGWDQLRIPAALETAFPGLPIAIGNDVQLAAQAELVWGSLKDVEHGVYLNLGSGIAAGIVVDGRLIHGGHGTAGELGYTLFRGTEHGRMAADGVAPFEAWFGGAGAERRLDESGIGGSVAEVVARRQDDPSARGFVDELWTGIGVMAANLCCALDPVVLSLGGGYVREDSGLLERIRQIVAAAVPHPPAVVRARFGADASLRGACATALDAIGALA